MDRKLTWNLYLKRITYKAKLCFAATKSRKFCLILVRHMLRLVLHIFMKKQNLSNYISFLPHSEWIVTDTHVSMANMMLDIFTSDSMLRMPSKILCTQLMIDPFFIIFSLNKEEWRCNKKILTLANAYWFTNGFKIELILQNRHRNILT